MYVMCIMCQIFTVCHSSKVPKKATSRSVRYWLRKAGIYSCWAARKPLLSVTNIKKRMEFARTMMGYDFSKVIFSDEKIWKIKPSSKNKVRVWRRRGDRFCARYVSPSVGVLLMGEPLCIMCIVRPICGSHGVVCNQWTRRSNMGAMP